MKTLMLDVDGVVITGAAHWTRTLEADLGIAPDALRRHFFEKHWHKVIIGQAELEPCLALALAQMGCAVPAPDLIDYWFAMDAAINDALLSDLADLRSKGVEVYLTTNQEHRRAAYLMETLDLQSHVDGIVYSAALGARKPDRAFFVEAARATGQPANGHLLIDDTLDNIKGARKAGWDAHHWETGQNLRVAYEQF